MDGFTIETFWRDEKTSDVVVDDKWAHATRYTTHPAKQLFHADVVSRFELGDVILKSRCFDPARPDKDKILEFFGLDEYNVYDICRRTHGIMAQDNIWMRFDGEEITWEDIKRLKA